MLVPPINSNVPAGIILCMRPGNETWRFSVTPSLIGWTHAQNDPCASGTANFCYLILSYLIVKEAHSSEAISVFPGVPSSDRTTDTSSGLTWKMRASMECGHSCRLAKPEGNVTNLEEISHTNGACFNIKMLSKQYKKFNCKILMIDTAETGER